MVDTDKFEFYDEIMSRRRDVKGGREKGNGREKRNLCFKEISKFLKFSGKIGQIHDNEILNFSFT